MRCKTSPKKQFLFILQRLKETDKMKRSKSDALKDSPSLVPYATFLVGCMWPVYFIIFYKMFMWACQAIVRRNVCLCATVSKHCGPTKVHPRCSRQHGCSCSVGAITITHPGTEGSFRSYWGLRISLKDTSTYSPQGVGSRQ